MASYPNPIPGYLYPKGATAPAGAFRVTRTSADHVATQQGKGIDIGNGRCDGKVLSIAAGRVFFTDKVQGVVRIKHNNGDEGHYAHMDPLLVAVGGVVAEGQQIGVVNDAHDPSITNFAFCHLHFGIVRGGVAIDPWPELAQNQKESEVPPPGSKNAGPAIGTFAWNGTGHLLISPSDTSVRFSQANNPGPFNVTASLDLKDSMTGKAVDIDGNQPPKPGRDQVYLVEAPTFGAGAYVLRADGTFTPAASGGSAAAEKKGASDAAAKAKEYADSLP